jgi:predicted dehydrogenase
VVGCGLVAQAMHLPYLRELRDRFDLVALSDLSPGTLAACARRFEVARTFPDWRALLEEPLDAVLVLTSGSHAPVAVAAAQAGRHVLVEKPMCYSAAEGRQMLDAAARAGVQLMMSYPLRYDPGFGRLKEELGRMNDLRLVQVTTLESPLAPYVAHYPMDRPRDLSEALLEELRADEEARLTAAVGTEVDLARRAYRWILLDTLVHEFNTVRGALGEPTALAHADVRERSLTTLLDFGGVPCVISWVDLQDGVSRYSMEFAFYAADRRLTLSYPSPFLRSMPALLTIDEGEVGTTRSWSTTEIPAYEEGFKRVLIEFHDAVTGERELLTPGIEGLRDVALCEATVASFRQQRPVPRPTDTSPR